MTTTKRKLNSNNRDKISELPERLIHHILSFLPHKDIRKTCCVSKTWNSVWNSFPVLIFEQDFKQNEDPFSDVEVDTDAFLELYEGSSEEEAAIEEIAEQSYRKMIDDFCVYIDNTINHRSSDTDIQKFKLIIDSQEYGDRTQSLNKWLNYAVSNNVQELVLHHRSQIKESDNREWRYELPVEFLSQAKNIKDLDLFGCTITSGKIDFQFSLTKLHLTHVNISEKTLQTLFRTCCFLEDFRMINCVGFHKVQLSSDKLERVDLGLKRGHEQSIAIEAPNLRFLSCSGNSASIRNSLEASNCKNVKELVLHDSDMTDDISYEVVSKFRQLRKLELIRCSLLESVRIPKVKLSDLTISLCCKLWRIELDWCRMNRFIHEESIEEVGSIKKYGCFPMIFT